ncbi:MAG: hypothetical protein EOM20_17735 [Spartobacteria bacterium]|nr:hypothetical protein [Spartobacteria bacterium]
MNQPKTYVADPESGQMIDLRTACPSSFGFLLLLPVNATTAQSRFNDTFTYTSPIQVADLVQDGSFDTAYNQALAH